VKNPFHLVMLLLVSNNFFIFIYGAASYSSALSAENNAKKSYALDSALALAYQDREDNSLMPELSRDFSVSRLDASYIIRKLDDGRDYIKVSVKSGRNTISREYITVKTR